jgi:hypothetical protein
MAKTVGYFENFTEESKILASSEGPFVLVWANGWRIEQILGECNCPVMPSLSILLLKEKLGWGPGKLEDFERAAAVCDSLNGMVRSGKIEFKQSSWRMK